MIRTRPAPRHTGASVLGRGILLTLLLGAVAALVGQLVDGPSAAAGVAVGTALIVVVCAAGSFLVDAVAGLLPAASLLVALLTYTLQVLAVLVVFLGLERSDLLGSTLDRQWLGGAAIAATLVWLGTQLLLTTRQRIPAYDLTTSGAAVTGVTSRSGAPEASER
jgi:ATP synthase protein I